MKSMGWQKIEGWLYLVGFIASVPLANWVVHNVGTFCVPNGPCLIPVAPGIDAPSGVLIIGLAFILRDFVQRRLGVLWSLFAIFVGAAISYMISPPSLVLASVSAFVFSELADFAVYTPLQKRNLIVAVVLSSIIGILIDSVIFLYLAFGSLDYILGQIIGKSWMVVISIPLVWLFRERDKRLGFTQD